MRDLWQYLPQDSAASVYSDHGIEYGDVCPDCLESGLRGKARLVENIQAENLLMSGALSREPLQLPQREAEFKPYRNRSM